MLLKNYCDRSALPWFLVLLVEWGMSGCYRGFFCIRLGLYELVLLLAPVMQSRGKVIQGSQVDGAVQGDADFEQSLPIKTPQRLQPSL